MQDVCQGEILKIEGIRDKVVVVSGDFFNRTEMVFVCPISDKVRDDALHIWIETEDASGFVMCEQTKLLDMRRRGFTKISKLGYSKIIDIVDTIQSIFDYV